MANWELRNHPLDSLDVGEDAPKDRLWLRPGRYARLTVADDGLGMDPVTKAYAFQPFFTTKPTGEGTGLGLSITYDIVTKQHGGTITVDSEVDEFTEFVVTLPRQTFTNGGSLP